MIWPLTILPRWNGRPKASTARFDGFTVLITGANTGLGLEAAKKLAAAGAATLIITARDEQKGKAAKSAIEAHLTSHNIPVATVIPLRLEMDDPTSIHAFLTTLKQHTTHLDHAILNAGVFATTYRQLPTTYESSIQINALSTTLLSLLLLPLLTASSLITQTLISQRPHLTLVSSYAAFMADLRTSPFLKSTDRPLAALSDQVNFPTGLSAGLTQYGWSKLMLEYALQRIAFLPSLSTHSATGTVSETPRVLISSVDPGPTATNIFREHSSGFVGAAIMGLVQKGLKTAEQGANAYVSSLTLGEEGRGQMWMDVVFVGRERKGNTEGEEGRKLGEKAWAEMREWLEREGGETVTSVLAGRGDGK
jgi:NAD(P)-dependent dehydrogenase (short-subunit alcohol dehydrogenase family)